jgi:uncharacterized delta-60 repeat protein
MINSKQRSYLLLLTGLLSLMLGGRLFSQAKEAFVNRYDGPAHADDEASAMKIDSDGNVYVTGTSAGIGTGMDYLTIKYSPEGDRLWVRRYDGPAHGADSTHALALDSDGNVYVTGESLGVGTEMDYATIKYDPDGHELWVRRYDGPDHLQDYAVAIAVDGAGHVYVTGTSKGRTSSFDFATVVYDSEGNLLWARRYNGPENEDDIATAIAVDTMGNAYVTGTSEGEDTHYDYATIKYGPDGREVWLRRYDGPDNNDDVPWALALDEAGHLYVTGQSTGLSHNYDIATIKYDADGRQMWVQRFNKNGDRTEDNVGRALTIDDDGFIYVAGSSVLNGLSDYATIKYDADGNEVWSQLYRGSGIGVNIATAVAVDPDGNVYVTGRSAGNRTGLDYATIAYDADGVMQWLERYDGPAHAEDAANALALDDDGNVYVTGSSVGLGTGKDCVTIKYTKR